MAETMTASEPILAEARAILADQRYGLFSNPVVLGLLLAVEIVDQAELGTGAAPAGVSCRENTHKPRSGISPDTMPARATSQTSAAGSHS